MSSFKISIPHFYCLEYREGKKTMFLDIDFRDSVKYIGKNLVEKWEPPYEHVVITEEDRNRIYLNVKQYMMTKFSKNNVIEEDSGGIS